MMIMFGEHNVSDLFPYSRFDNASMVAANSVLFPSGIIWIISAAAPLKEVIKATALSSSSHIFFVATTPNCSLNALNPNKPAASVRTAWTYSLEPDGLITYLNVFELGSTGSVEEMRRRLAQFLTGEELYEKPHVNWGTSPTPPVNNDICTQPASIRAARVSEQTIFTTSTQNGGQQSILTIQPQNLPILESSTNTIPQRNTLNLIINLVESRSMVAQETRKESRTAAYK
uniref:Uncharacterized protein n=1 Tax=Glossina pallidipes TaxID=7398 RepID=A0A1A9ZSF1_GLOPL